jgi:hypothetical protein
MALLLALATQSLVAQDKEKPAKTVAGKSELLRDIPKKFASYLGFDAQSRKVRVLLEGDKEPSLWALKPDAEIKVRGDWGRLEQFQSGQRVWVWFDLDRAKKPRAILMLADETSQQDLNGLPLTLEAIDMGSGRISLKPARGESRTLLVGKDLRAEALRAFKSGQKVYVQSVGDTFVDLQDEVSLEKARSAQRLWLRKLWEKEGLPGSVVFLHPLGGEMDYMLDHEAMRWGRSLKTGDVVKLNTGKPIQAQVKSVRPWRERTLLRLVTGGFDQADLQVGERVSMTMQTPPLEVDTAELPPDVDRMRSREERVEWILSSIYCSCKVAGDRCTGMFYSLASCNENACAMPRLVRRQVAALLDEGKTDRQILDKLRQDQGPLVFKQHLLP